MKKFMLLCLTSLMTTLMWSQAFVDENFSGGVLPAGWTNNDLDGGGNVWLFDNPGGQTGISPISAPFAIIDSDYYGNGETQDAALETPPFDASTATGVILDFDYYHRQCCGATMYVEVFNGASWVEVHSESSQSTNPAHLTLDITTTLNGATNAQVRFRYTGEWDWYWIIDNVKIAPPPSCLVPSALTVDATTTTTANVSWTPDGSETDWNISWGTPGFIVGGAGELGTDSVNTTAAYEIIGLDPSTVYEFYIQSDCGEGDVSDWSAVQSFATLCDAISVFPYEQNFNSVTTPNLPLCWTENNVNSDGDFWQTYPTYGVGGSIAAGIYTDFNNGLNNDYLISPQFTLTGNESVRFSVRARSASEPNDFRVVLSTTDQAPASFTEELLPLTVVASTTYQEYFINLSAYSGDVYIAIHVPADGLDGYYLYVDDFFVETLPPCPEPTALTVDATTTTTADVSWTAGNTETDWDIYWGTPGFTVGGAGQIGTDVANTTTAYTITGLSANTEYEFIVQADCGVDGQSILSDPASFRTACDPFGDFVENFDTTTTGQVPSCWSTLKENSVSAFAVVNVSTSFPVSAPNSIRFTNSNDATASLYLITPELTALSEGDHQLRFSYRGNNFSTLEVGTMSDPTNASSFTLVEALTTTTSHAEYLVLFNQSYADAVIAFKVTFSSTYNSSYLDDVNWEPMPACPDPSALTVGVTTPNTADVSWTAGNTETDWNISWGTPGFIVGGAGELGTDSVNTTAAYQITGLDANTQYEVRVQADCGEGNESAWLDPVDFTTACDAIAVFPYEENFNSVTTPNLPDCWRQNNANADDRFWQTYTTYGVGGSVAAGLYTDFRSGNNNDYLIAPQFTLTGNESVRFSVRARSTGEPNDFRVVLSTTDQAPASFTEELLPLTAVASTTYQEYLINLSAYSGNVYIAIHVPAGGLDGWYLYVDDFFVETLPTCPEPTALTVDAITGTTADVSWTAGNTETDWNISWGTPGFIVGGAGQIGTDIVNTIAAYQITGLDANTQYEVRVQADCGEGDESAWVGITIQTPCAPGAIPFMEGFESGYADQAAVAGCWSQESLNGAQNWTANNTLTTYNRSPRTGSFNAYLRYSNTDWIYYPLTLDGGTAYELKFFARQDVASGTSVEAAWGTADNSAAMTNTIIASSPVTNGEYQEFSGTFIPPSNGVYYIGIKATLTFAPYYISLDDISVDVASGYYYVNGAWSPSDPSVYAGPTDDIFVVDGVTSFTTDMEVNDITVMSGATLNIEGVLTSNGNITNDGDLVFVSTDTRNGELAAVAGTITGDVTVERYMKNRRSYRMVSSAVTTTSSIHDNWQEGATGSTDNPNPGFGTHITGSTTDQEFGFDGTITGNPSMFFVDGAAQAFTAVANTDVNTLTAGFPYLLFVRGDRNIDLTDPTDNLSSSTVLRATGSLVTGTQTQNFPTVEAGNVVMFGNPYQSAVDMDVVRVNSTNLNTNHYYVYDPNIATYGGYVTVSFIGAPNTPPSAANQYLQPGQGAQMATLAAGPSAVIFNESDKAPGQFTDTNRNPMSINDMLTVQLYTTENFNNGGSVHDSFGIIFAEGNNNGLTSVDAVKPMNFYENLGVNHNGTYLSLEYREMPQPAEVYPLYSTGYSKSDYTLKLTIDGLEASFFYLDDHFTGTTTLLDAGDTTYGFTVDANDPMSIATDRFSIRTEQRLGIDDNSLLAGIRLFPNPLNGDTFYINAPKLNGEQLSVSISDLTGRSIYKQTLDCRANTVTVPMGDNMSSGVYLVTLKHGGEAHTYRLIKE